MSVTSNCFVLFRCSTTRRLHTVARHQYPAVAVVQKSWLHDHTLSRALFLLLDLSSVFSALLSRLRTISQPIVIWRCLTRLVCASTSRNIRTPGSSPAPTIVPQARWNQRQTRGNRIIGYVISSTEYSLTTTTSSYDHELLHVKLKSSSSPAPDLARFRIPSLTDLVMSSTVVPRFLFPVFSSPRSVPSATNL